jgi:hypothetical protein
LRLLHAGACCCCCWFGLLLLLLLLCGIALKAVGRGVSIETERQPAPAPSLRARCCCVLRLAGCSVVALWLLLLLLLLLWLLLLWLLLLPPAHARFVKGAQVAVVKAAACCWGRGAVAGICCRPWTLLWWRVSRLLHAATAAATAAVRCGVAVACMPPRARSLGARERHDGLPLRCLACCCCPRALLLMLL